MKSRSPGLKIILLILILTSCTNANIEIGILSKNSNSSSNSPYLHLNGIQNPAILTKDKCIEVSMGSFLPNNSGGGPNPKYIAQNDIYFEISASGGGVFYGSAANCNSQSMPVSGGSTIPAGSSNSSMAYFRPSTTGSYQFSITTTSKEVRANQIPYSVGLPIVRPNFPTKMVAGACYGFVAILYEADGIREMQAPSSANYTINAKDNAMNSLTALYSDSACSTGVGNSKILPFVGGNSRSTSTFYIKSPSGGVFPLNFTATIDVGNVSVPDTVVDLGSGANIIDGVKFKVFPMNQSTNAVAPGDCTMARAILTNTYDTVVPSGVSAYKVKLSALDYNNILNDVRAQFYTDGSCTTNLLTAPNFNRLDFNQAQYEKEFWFRINASVGTDIQLAAVVHGSDLIRQKANYYKSDVVNIKTSYPDELYVFAELFDFWKLTYIGDHEFVPNKQLQFQTSNIPGQTLNCTANGSGSPDCGGRFNAVSKILTLNATEFSNVEYNITVASPSGNSKNYTFSRLKTYPLLQPVQTCGATETIGVSTLNAASIICYNSGVLFSVNSSLSLVGKTLIGHSDGTSSITQGSIGTFTALSTTGTVVANFNVANFSGTNSIFNFSGTETGPVTLSNLKITHDNSSLKAISMALAGSQTKLIRDVSLTRTIADPTINAIEIQKGSNNLLENVIVDDKLGGAINYNANAAGSNVSVQNSYFYATKKLIQTYQASGVATLNLNSTTIEKTVAGDTSELLSFGQYSDNYLKQNYVVSAPSAYLVSRTGTSVGTNFYDNLFIQNGSQLAFFTNSNGTSTFDRNHFVKNGGGSAQYLMYIGVNSKIINATTANTNYVCSKDGFDKWVGLQSGTPFSATGVFAGTPLTIGSLSPRNLCSADL